MNKIIQSITEEELQFISAADYEQETTKHYKALKKIIFKQNGIINKEQTWFPYEVIELSSNVLKEHHEREFVICTLLIILNVRMGTDLTNDLEHKFSSFSGEYEKLSKPLVDLVLNEFAKATN